MGNKADFRRRMIGATSLGAALMTLIAGETVLRERLSAVGQLVLYLVCFGFTFLAVLIAFLDLVVTRQRVREEHRALLEDTLKDIAREKESKARKPR